MTPLEQQILDSVQDGFPLEERPYRGLAERFGAQGVPVSEQQVFETVESLRQSGIIRRIGGIYDSKRLGFISRLCAGKVPTAATGASDDSALEKFAAAVDAVPAITHNYVRSHEYNVWFTVIALSEGEIRKTVDRLCAETALHDVHVLTATKKFKINTVMKSDERRGTSDERGGSALRQGSGTLPPTGTRELSTSDRDRIRVACTDIPHTPTPFADWGVSVEELRRDLAQKRMRRFGAILRHQQAGFAYNAMVCFRVGAGSEAGETLAKNPHVSHCYERPAFEGFPYTLYAMMHASSAAELERYIGEAAQSIGGPGYVVLHSLRELKKTSFSFFA